MSLTNRPRALVLIIVFGLGFVSANVSAQTAQPERRTPDLRLPSVSFPAGKSFVEVPFEVEGNWMVIPVSVNGSRPLRFILDTGASATVLYNSTAADSLNLKMTGTMPVRGAGGGGAPVEVSVAEDVGFNIGGVEFSGGRLAVRKSSSGSSAQSARDGVIGRIVFATLVVEVDWEKRAIKLYDPARYKYSGSGAVLPLTFDEGGRPYTMASVSVTGEKRVPVKLVVDTGGSHTLQLHVGSKPEITLPEGARKAVLGRGAGGEITGHVGGIKSFEFGGQTLTNVPTDFPDSSAGTEGRGGRQGNVGSGVLRRFKVTYDYSRRQMIVEPNKFFGEPFVLPPTATAAVTNVSPSALQDYVGRYGERTITSEGGALFLQRRGGPKIALTASGKDEFSIERMPAARIRFARDGAGGVTEIQVLNPEGSWEKSKKEAGDQPVSRPQNERELSQAEREVRKLEREWLDAYEERDAEAMSRILSDDFKLTFPDGSVQTRDDVLAQLKSARDSGRPPPKFKTEDVQSRVEGDTVILTGRVIQTTERGGQTRTMQMLYTDTYAKRQGRWQVITSRLTRGQQQ